MQVKGLYYKPKEYGGTIFKGGKLIISDWEEHFKR